MQKKVYLVIATLVFTFLVFLPSLIISTCPKGLVNDSFPGRCPLYVDKTQDGFCDLSQVNVTTALKPSKSFNFSYLPASGVFLAFLVAGFVFVLKNKPSFRYPILAASLIFGVFTFKNLCPIGFLQLLLIFKDQAVLNFFPFLIFFIILLTSLIFGKIFCGWVCPIGAAQEFFHSLPRFLKLKVANFTGKVPPAARLLPIFILMMVGFWVVRSGTTAFCKLDPFGFLFGFSEGLIFFAGLIVILTISVFIFRPFCLFLCPLGAILTAFSSVSVWEIKKNKKVCHACGLCRKKCPTKAISKDFEVDQAVCIRCQECVISCPQKALSYKS